jgi:hypothetical protein
MRWSSRAHVVLGMDFEEATLSAFGHDSGEVLVLEACPRETGDRECWKAERNGCNCRRFGRRLHFFIRFPAIVFSALAAD